MVDRLGFGMLRAAAAVAGGGGGASIMRRTRMVVVRGAWAWAARARRVASCSRRVGDF